MRKIWCNFQISRLFKPVKDCKAFCRIVNFLSSLFKDLGKHPKNIGWIPKSERFHWTEEFQKAFIHIKELLIVPPVLYILTAKNKFRLESNTSKNCYWGSTVLIPTWSMGIHWLLFNEITSNLKILIIELELTGSICNIHIMRHLLKHHYFEVLVDHKAMETILRGRKALMTDW